MAVCHKVKCNCTSETRTIFSAKFHRRKVGAVWGLDSIQIRFEETQNQCYIYNTGQKINWFVIIFTKTLKENYTLFIDHNRCFQIVPT